MPDNLMQKMSRFHDIMITSLECHVLKCRVKKNPNIFSKEHSLYL